MDINKLMIGDIVKYNGYIAKIYSIHGPESRYGRFDIVPYVTLSLDGLIDAMCDDIKPVPLTREILEKNGFSWIEDEDELSDYEYDGCMVLYSDEEIRFYPKGIVDRYCVIEIGDTDSTYIRLYINYVHELQQALRLCGLFELVDKLKA